jgi:hypothetical protein
VTPCGRSLRLRLKGANCSAVAVPLSMSNMRLVENSFTNKPHENSHKQTGF